MCAPWWQCVEHSSVVGAATSWRMREEGSGSGVFRVRWGLWWACYSTGGAGFRWPSLGVPGSWLRAGPGQRGGGTLPFAGRSC